MGKAIKIKASGIEVTAELNETRTAQAIWDALPITGQANRWGDEIYFSIPVRLEEEDGQELVSMGDLGYWPPGAALCLFFGPTPISKGKEIRPASAVNVFGRIIGNASVLKQVASGTEIIIERETEG
ncbi:hypothetical protein ES703_39755 [subsurface metagenome]